MLKFAFLGVYGYTLYHPSLYSKERPQFPFQESIAHRSNKNAQQLTVHSSSMPGPLSPKHRGGLTGDRFPWAIQYTPKMVKPAHYTKDLCPLPSTRRPHVLASKCLQCWIPLHGWESAENSPSNLTPEDIWQIAIVMGKLWEELTLAAYGSGLLNFHVYCDQKGIPDDQCMPASPILINTFISSLAGTYSGSTIDNYVYGIRAWHILHGVRWQMDTAELEALLKLAEKTTPLTSRRKKRVPYTLDFILAIWASYIWTSHSMLQSTAASQLLSTWQGIWGSLWYQTSQLSTRKYTSRHLTSELSMTEMASAQPSSTSPGPRPPCMVRMSLGPNNQVTLIWKQPLCTTWQSTNPQPMGIFSYLKDSQYCPLMKMGFIRTVAAAVRKAGLDPCQGHSIHIGSTLEYLLRETPSKVMKVKGWWASDAFLVYLTKHAQVLTLYMQAVPEVHKNFIRITMPHIQLLHSHWWVIPLLLKVWFPRLTRHVTELLIPGIHSSSRFTHREDLPARMESPRLLPIIALHVALPFLHKDITSFINLGLHSTLDTLLISLPTYTRCPQALIQRPQNIHFWTFYCGTRTCSIDLKFCGRLVSMYM